MSIKELNESEPFDEVSKGLLVVKSIGVEPPMLQTIAEICLLAMEQPALRRQELYTGFCTELGKTATTMCQVPYHMLVIQGISQRAEV